MELLSRASQSSSAELRDRASQWSHSGIQTKNYQFSSVKSVYSSRSQLEALLKSFWVQPFAHKLWVDRDLWGVNLDEFSSDEISKNKGINSVFCSLLELITRQLWALDWAMPRLAVEWGWSQSTDAAGHKSSAAIQCSKSSIYSTVLTASHWLDTAETEL